MSARQLKDAFLLISLLSTIGCDGRSPASPSPVSPSPVSTRASYAGEWSGTTAQGDAIAFTVSNEHKVTALTVSYRFAGCSVARSISPLSLDIGYTPNPTAAGNPGFGYGEGDPEKEILFSLYGEFRSPDTAHGFISVLNYMGCRFAGATWDARKR